MRAAWAIGWLAILLPGYALRADEFTATETVIPSLPPQPVAVAPVDLQWGWIFPYQSFANAPRNVWVQAEYLLFRTKEAHLPPLVTGGPPGSAAVLGEPDTLILVGDIDADHQGRSGGRFEGGLWLDYDQAIGVEGGYLFLGERTVHLPAGAAVAPEMPILARPFFDVLNNQQSSSLAIQPDLRTALVDVAYSSFFQAADCSIVCNCSYSPSHRIDLLAGFRYLELADEVRIAELSKIDSVNPQFGGYRLEIQDEFETRTRLLGGQLALRAEVRQKGWFGSVVGRVSFGGVEQQISNSGLTFVAPPDRDPYVLDGGFLALPTNLGLRDRWEFAAVPELTVRLGYTLWHKYTIFAGWSILYWGNVLRAGDQIDLRLNPSQFSFVQRPSDGPALPDFLFQKTDFWIQGVSLGVEVRF